MAINYCTIGKNTVNGFCDAQRVKVLERLIEQAGHGPTPNPPTYGGGGSTFRPQQAYLSQYRPADDEDKVIFPTESPFITVTAELFGKIGTETQEVTPRLDFVVVTDFEIISESQSPVTVNITILEI